MIYIPNSCHDPALNLAGEEHILTGSGIAEPVLFFYVNEPSVIIGRHQNTLDEINAEYVRQNNIRIVRRLSGGGAVYHDLGNLNYSLIRPGDPRASSDFSELLIPILNAMHSLGLDAELNGRNDMTLRGAKFSGNASYHNRFGSVIHGTLLYDSDLDVLTKVLMPHPEKFLAKGISSVRSRVCCIKDVLPGINSIESLEQAIVSHFSDSYSLQSYRFTDEDRERILKIADRRYLNDQWNYGESPAYTIRRYLHQPSGWIDFRADVRDGKIQSARFFGDYFCSAEISELESSLSGVRWDAKCLLRSLSEDHWHLYFPDYPAESFVCEIFRQSADG